MTNCNYDKNNNFTDRNNHDDFKTKIKGNETRHDEYSKTYVYANICI